MPCLLLQPALPAATASPACLPCCQAQRRVIGLVVTVQPHALPAATASAACLPCCQVQRRVIGLVVAVQPHALAGQILHDSQVTTWGAGGGGAATHECEWPVNVSGFVNVSHTKPLTPKSMPSRHTHTYTMPKLYIHTPHPTQLQRCSLPPPLHTHTPHTYTHHTHTHLLLHSVEACGPHPPTTTHTCC